MMTTEWASFGSGAGIRVSKQEVGDCLHDVQVIAFSWFPTQWLVCRVSRWLVAVAGSL